MADLSRRNSLKADLSRRNSLEADLSRRNSLEADLSRRNSLEADLSRRNSLEAEGIQLRGEDVLDFIKRRSLWSLDRGFAAECRFRIAREPY